MNLVLRKCWPVALAAAMPALLLSQDSGKKLSDEEMARFLETAKIVKMKSAAAGITGTQRASLDGGAIKHDAHVQCIDEHKAKFEGDTGTEINFVDSWMYNVAAYRLARMLGIGDMIPMSIERKVDDKPCAVTWWLDDSTMESERVKKKVSIPNLDSWNKEMYVLRVFDQLIYNVDSNLTNLLIDPQWHLWFIDHTRSFRLYTALKSKKDLARCDRQLLANLRTLDAAEMETLKPYLTASEIKGVLARREKIVQFFDQEIKDKGEAAVLYDRPAR